MSDQARRFYPGGGGPGPTFPGGSGMANMGAAGGMGAMLGGPLGWATLGMDVLGGMLGGNAEAKRHKEQMDLERERMRQQRYQYDRSQTQSEGQDVVGLANSIDMAPIRDRAAYMMKQRQAQTPGGFNPGDVFNRGSIGMVDRDALKRANDQYTPGAGGTAQSEAMKRALLQRFGYGQGQGVPAGAPAAAPSPPPGGMDPQRLEQIFRNRRHF